MDVPLSAMDRGDDSLSGAFIHAIDISFICFKWVCSHPVVKWTPWLNVLSCPHPTVFFFFFGLFRSIQGINGWCFRNTRWDGQLFFHKANSLLYEINKQQKHSLHIALKLYWSYMLYICMYIQYMYVCMNEWMHACVFRTCSWTMFHFCDVPAPTLKSWSVKTSPMYVCVCVCVCVWVEREAQVL